MLSTESAKKLLHQQGIFHEQYNSIYPLCLAGIVGYPNQKTLLFLDSNATINQDSLYTSIYIKKTFTGPGTNYNSFIHSSFINNSASTLNFFTNNGYLPLPSFLIKLSINFYTLYFHQK